jgi:acetyl esterase/lipase
MLRYLLISLIFMSCAASIPAQQKNEIPVWQDKAVTAGSAYEPTMTCYLPETPNGITVMICPGGGYDHLAITHEGHDLAPWFNAQGITYIVLKYRLPKDGVNYPLIDAQQAMIIVREQASRSIIFFISNLIMRLVRMYTVVYHSSVLNDEAGNPAILNKVPFT